MNIQMKVITNENIDQLTNVSFSKNKLENFDFSGKGEAIQSPSPDEKDKEVVVDKETTANVEDKEKENISNETIIQQYPPPGSPDYAPPGSPDYAPDSSSISDSAEIPPPPPPYDDSSDSSAIPNVIKVDSNVILMKPGNQKQDIYSTNLAEKEKELQLELDILDTKQKIAALNNDSNRSDSISSMNDEISIQPRVSKRNDGIELLIDSSEEPKSDDYRTNNNDTSDKLRYDKKSDDNNSSNSDTKQIRI